MEYCYAYERLKEGKLDILPFVRREVWDIREDRKALRQYLEQHQADHGVQLSQQQAHALVNHPSKLVDDAEFITAFINEVARVPEMKTATKGVGEYPVGNWIYQFSSFKDIVDACKTVLNLSGNLRHKALVANLKYELQQNFRELLERRGEQIEPVTRLGQFARASLHGDFAASSQYKGDHLVWLYMSLMCTVSVGKRLNRTMLKEAILSGDFLDYDRQTGKHTVGEVQKALLDLDGQIERLQSIGSDVPFADHWLVQNEQYIKARRMERFTIENEKMVMAFAIYDRIENIIVLSNAIYNFLDGRAGAINRITLHGSSPIEKENELMEAERPSQADIWKVG